MKWIANADLDSIENKCTDDDSIKKFLLFYDIKHLNSMLPRVCVEIINEDVKMCWLHLSSIAEQMKGNMESIQRLFLTFFFEILRRKLAHGRPEFIPVRMPGVLPLCYETLLNDHSGESSWAILSCSTIQFA